MFSCKITEKGMLKKKTKWKKEQKGCPSASLVALQQTLLAYTQKIIKMDRGATKKHLFRHVCTIYNLEPKKYMIIHCSPRDPKCSSGGNQPVEG
jgi:predicted transcriptional regulator